MQEAEKTTEDFIKKKKDTVEIDITSAKPSKTKGAWTVKGAYTEKINEKTWPFNFSVDIDKDGNITGYNLNL